MSEAEMGLEECRRRQLLKGVLADGPEHMTLVEPEIWADCVANNDDPYGKAGVEYAELWARVMESRVAAGAKLEDVADEASHIADVEGITGFMHGMAVSILSKVWVHGEALRRWHNLKTQIRDEGEKANESGGVLNPALLTLDA